ncbi:VanW family protein [Deinococcus planocerae]|uniref:VanW family protein n=1 Tax=Deinococcus planocerae TaxID=1737569 RepID=UPI001FEACFA0|nr:VanW family protein [Deinococcus planocerae]
MTRTARRGMSPLGLALRLALLGGVSGAVGSAGLAPGTSRPPRPAPPLPLTLQVSAPEPVLRGGRVERPLLQRRYVLTLTPEQVRQVREQGSVAPLKSALEAVYARIDARKPRDAVFRRVGGVWTAQGQTGWTVRRDRAERAVLDALQEGRRTAQVEVGLTPPARSVRTLRERGVVAHLAAGESSFAGSPDFRVHNIRVGGGRLHGGWVEPGAVYDFNARTGAINRARGFVPGYVIAGGTLALEDGGGICQVSTTVFRAAYLAGLPIVERHAHSHQVAYYDPVGFEATVYAPSKNLRFRNDTGGPLLMQVSWDLERETLRVDLFGGPSDRQVQVSEPRVSDRRPALPPTFLADPGLAPGETRRVDMPASGMRVELVRRVQMKGGEVRTDRLLSRYRPWGGVFAVHPGDDRLR